MRASSRKTGFGNSYRAVRSSGRRPAGLSPGQSRPRPRPTPLEIKSVVEVRNLVPLAPRPPRPKRPGQARRPASGGRRTASRPRRRVGLGRDAVRLAGNGQRELLSCLAQRRQVQLGKLVACFTPSTNSSTSRCWATDEALRSVTESFIGKPAIGIAASRSTPSTATLGFGAAGAIDDDDGDWGLGIRDWGLGTQKSYGFRTLCVHPRRESEP